MSRYLVMLLWVPTAAAVSLSALVLWWSGAAQAASSPAVAYEVTLVSGGASGQGNGTVAILREFRCSPPVVGNKLDMAPSSTTSAHTESANDLFSMWTATARRNPSLTVGYQDVMVKSCVVDVNTSNGKDRITVVFNSNTGPATGIAAAWTSQTVVFEATVIEDGKEDTGNRALEALVEMVKVAGPMLAWLLAFLIGKGNA